MIWVFMNLAEQDPHELRLDSFSKSQSTRINTPASITGPTIRARYFCQEARSKGAIILLSPVLLPVGDDGEAVRVVPVAADVRVPPGHTC